MSSAVEMDVSGPLTAILRRMERSHGVVIREVSEFAVNELEAAVSDVFDAEGPGWAALKVRSGSILRDTGVMAASFEAGVESPGLILGAFGTPYAKFHITGTSRMPKRNPLELGPFEGPMLQEIVDFAQMSAARRLSR